MGNKPGKEEWGWLIKNVSLMRKPEAPLLSMTFSNSYRHNKSAHPPLHYPDFLMYLLWLILMNLSLRICFVFV